MKRFNLSKKRNRLIMVVIVSSVIVANTITPVVAKQVVSKGRYVDLKKSEERTIGWISASLGVQMFLLGTAISIEGQNNPNHIFTSIALAMPPLTPVYTEDWDLGVNTYGLSIISGSFFFLGSTLKKNHQRDNKRKVLGTALQVLGITAKVAALIMDLEGAGRSVDTHNKSVSKKYTTASNARLLSYSHKY